MVNSEFICTKSVRVQFIIIGDLKYSFSHEVAVHIAKTI